MSVFRFSLEQVLGYRKQLEEQAMMVHAQAVRARDRRLEQKRGYEAERAENLLKLAEVASLTPEERWLINGYVTGLNHEITQAEADLVGLEEDVDRTRTELTQRAQDRKLLEKLKEKQATRHRLAENHSEQKTYDDIATIRFTPSAL